MELNLSKQALKAELSKVTKVDLSNKSARVCLVLDQSGSMHDLYAKGHVEAMVKRALVVSLEIDDDGDIDVIPFNHSCPLNNSYVLNQHHFDNPKLPVCTGGTDFDKALATIVEYYNPTSEGKVKGMFNKLFGLKPKEVTEPPVYVIFITDGESHISQGTFEYLAGRNIFINFVCLGSQGLSYVIQNAAQQPYIDATFISDPISMSDGEFFDKILSTKLLDLI